MSVKFKKNMGFTFVELLIVLALLALTIGAIFTFFSFAQGGFRRTDIQSRLLHEMNIALRRISGDIRSASRPNAATYSVVAPDASGGLVKGQSIWIYGYDQESEVYHRVCYRLDPSNKTILQRGVAVCSGSPPSGKNPEYAEITDWENILTGVVYKDESDNEVSIFEDLTSPSTNERRKIHIGIKTNDEKTPLPEPVEVSMTVTSRSEGVPG
jgi:type II secretory pathway pseudopilin PulG